MTPLLEKLFSRIGLKFTQPYTVPFVPSRGTTLNKAGLPSHYSGAKLHRRAVQKGIGVKHHGLRCDGVTV